MADVEVDMGKRVLVTGGGGFIGSRLVRALLQKGCRVKVLDVQPGRLEKEENPNLEFIGLKGDELTGGMVERELVRQAVKGVDVIYHLALAWKQGAPLAKIFDANVKGTLNLLEVAKSNGVKHFIFSSSSSVYGESNSLITHEDDACNPERCGIGPGPAYPIVKLTTEKLCLFYHRQFGLPVTVFRITAVFDEARAHIAEELIEKALRGEDIEVIEGQGDASVHVDEVVQAFLLATLNEDAYGQVFNLSNHNTYMSYREMCQIVIQSVDSKSRIKLITDPMALGSVLDGTEKIQRVLGWKPQKTRKDLKRAIINHAQSSKRRRSHEDRCAAGDT